jgi:hypothetical protein
VGIFGNEKNDPGLSIQTSIALYICSGRHSTLLQVEASNYSRQHESDYLGRQFRAMTMATLEETLSSHLL